MVPFDSKEPIRLLETIARPQTANPKGKAGKATEPPKSAVPYIIK